MTRKCLSVYLDPQQLEELRSLSAKTGVSMQAYLREAAAAVLRKYDAAPKPKPESR